MIEGIDAAWARPTPAQMQAAGKQFIIGYVSHDGSKNLSADDCQAYLDAGIWVGLVWETTAQRALAGGTAGAADGKEARKQANALGFPASKPIFTAVDFDATQRQLTGPVHDYLEAFASSVGGVPLAGVYGGIATVSYALDRKLVGFGWQTYAWSHGEWDGRAQLQQYRNGVRIAGHDTDLTRAVDLAAFWTKENTDMSLVPTDAHVVWASSYEIPDMRDQSKADVTPATALAQTWADVLAAQAALAALKAQIDALPAAIAKAVVAALPSPASVTTSGDVEVTGTLHLGGPQ